MGTVEVAIRKDGGFSRLFAVKRLLPAHRDDPSFREMFLEEARLAGLLRHPNAVSVLDIGEDEDGPFLLMEFIEGLSLARIVRHVKACSELLPLQIVLRVAADVARGLHAAHELAEHEHGRPASAACTHVQMNLHQITAQACVGGIRPCDAQQVRPGTPGSGRG